MLHPPTGDGVSHPNGPKERFLRMKEVQRRVSLSRASIYRFQALKQFPHSVSLGANSVAWAESEIDAWIQQRIINRQAVKVSDGVGLL